MNTKKLSNKVAVVTGASKGIGAGIAKALAGEGASVVVNYSSSKADGEKVAKEITSAGGKAVAVQANLSKAKDVEQLFAESKKAFGRVDILVNNAGIYEFGPLESLTEEHFHKQFNLNVLGLPLASQARRSNSTATAEASSISVPSSAPWPFRAALFTAAQKGQWMPLRVRSRRNSLPVRFALTPFGQGW